MARPIWHLLSALPPTVLALWRGRPLAALAAAGAAVAIDIDHLVDWSLNGGREDYSRRIVVPLHGWEFPLMLMALALAPALDDKRRAAMAALAGGWACHLLLDYLVNRPQTPLGYSLLRRACVRFERRACGWLPVAEWRLVYGAVHRAAPREALAAGALGAALSLIGAVPSCLGGR
jgi:hypothetical protein